MLSGVSTARMETIGPGPAALDVTSKIGGRSRLVKKTPVYSFGGRGVVRQAPVQSWQLAPAGAEYDLSVSLGRQQL